MPGGGVRCKFAQLASNHFFSYGDVHVVFAIMYLELLIDKIWQDGRRSRLCLDRNDLLAGLRADDGQSMDS